MANKGAKELSAAKFGVKPGPSGKMAGFKPVGKQAPGVTATTGSGGGKKWAKPDAGPSGKMHGFSGTKPQKSGRTSQS